LIALRFSVRPRRALSLVAIAMLVIGSVVACGGGSDAPRSTPLPPEIRAATSTASAIERELRKAPCVVSPHTRSLLREVADELWAIGTDLGDKGEGSLGLKFYEASIAYGILTECREVEGTPTADGSPMASPAAGGTPVTTAAACLDPERTIRRLREAVIKGGTIVFTASFQGIDLESLPTMLALNNLLADRAQELEIACGLRTPATPGAAATP
jgi:hypothetical protein